MEFMNKKERLPFLKNKKDFEELKTIFQKINYNINYEQLEYFEKEELIFNKKITKNICFSASAWIPYMNGFIGGVIC